MSATDPVQAVAKVLIAHTRLSVDGRCSCGHVVPLGHSVAEHQAEAAVAAALPAIEREAKAEAWDEGANAARQRSTPEVNDVIAVVQSRAVSIEDAWAVLAAARPGIEREAKAAALRELVDRLDRRRTLWQGGSEGVQVMVDPDDPRTLTPLFAWLRDRADRIEREGQA